MRFVLNLILATIGALIISAYARPLGLLIGITMIVVLIKNSKKWER